MNTQEMLEENLRVASQAEANSFTNDDMELFTRVRDILYKKIKVPCTGCNYCMPCPMGVDIPTCFSCYNNLEIDGKKKYINYIMKTSLKKQDSNASLCSKCGKCEKHCPQKIAIRDEIAKVARSLERFFYKPLKFVIKKIMKI
jgi:predicted aldo/keto reductase-like oxidoreductase